MHFIFVFPLFLNNHLLDGRRVSKGRVLAALGLRDDDLLGAFVWGSRAFGTSTTSSGTCTP
jgi:hypothetical protein